MVDQPQIGIASPARAGDNNGNWHTAARWAEHLRPLADVRIFEQWDGRPLRVLVALHARKSAAAVEAFRQSMPQGRIVLVMTGTDLYRDLPRGDAQALRSIALANRIVVLQERALAALPDDARPKARVIEQSASPIGGPRPARTPGGVATFIAIGHLRAEKDPLTLARAAVRLRAEPRVVIEHVGDVLDAGLAAEVAALARDCAGYRWLGGLPHPQALARLQAADALVHPSRMEGGANVVIEAVQCGVPVLASAIDGNIGLLGADYEGYFPPGDDAALAAAMRRFAADSGFAAALARRCDALRRRFEPAVEAAAVRALVAELL
jgi:putative glycosyltransferase (TIGR04348 family)